MVRLVYSDQNGRERFVEIGPQNGMIMIGRNADCAIQTQNASVSRVHAMITFKDGKVFVQDPPNARPTNGTKVDGMRLQQGEILELFAGSELICGNFGIRVFSSGNDGIAAMGPSGAYEKVPAAAQARAPMNYPAGMPAQMMGHGPGQGPARLGPPAGHPHTMAHAQGAHPPANHPAPQAPTAGYYEPKRVQPQRTQGPSPAQPQRPNYAAPSMPMPAQMPSSSNEDFLRLNDELIAAKRELDELRSGIVAKDDEIKNLRERINEREQTLTDYERRSEYHETVVTSFKDRIDKLKEQLEHQKEQAQEHKRDLLAAEETNENLEIELSTLRETLESKGMATSNQETTIANLKVQLTQKNRQLSEIQRELDLSQFAAKEERENAERLEQNVQELNTLLEESQRRTRDMKKVVEQHEAMYSDMKSSLEERAREIRSLQDALRAKGGGDSAMLVSELAQNKELLGRRTRENEQLLEQLRAAEGAIAEMQRKQGDEGLMSALASANGRIAVLEAELKAARFELSQAQQSAPSPVQSASVDGEQLSLLRTIYEQLNDGVSQWREDLDSLDNVISDLQRVFVAYVRIDINSLQGPDKIRVENAVKDYNPKVLFEDLSNLLDMGQNSLGQIKDNLRDLRAALQA